MTEKIKFTITDIKPDEFKALNENPTPAPQPLTDEEVEAIRQREAERDDCMECARYEDIQKLLARIRADGRRIRELETFVRSAKTALLIENPESFALDPLRAALEDKTK